MAVTLSVAFSQLTVKLLEVMFVTFSALDPTFGASKSLDIMKGFEDWKELFTGLPMSDTAGRRLQEPGDAVFVRTFPHMISGLKLA